MADAHYIICAYLKFPPEQRAFFRIREIPFIFLEQLNRLSLVLAAAHESHPCPEALRIVRDLREAAGEQCNYLAGVLFYGHRFAKRYLDLLDALAQVSVKHETTTNILRVNTNAGLAAEEMEGAQRAMGKFRQHVVDAVRRITDVLNDNKSPDSPVFMAEKAQAVTELLNAVDECSTLLLQRGDYYREIEQQTEDEPESIESSRPADEEIKMMEERWSTFYTDVADLRSGFGILHGRLVEDGGIQRVDGSYHSQPFGNAVSGGSPNPADASNGRKPAPDASASGPSPSTKPKTSFWRPLLRRLF